MDGQYRVAECKMNLEEYFKRIGFHGSNEKLDLATLKLIHKQHVMSIPFENLSIHCGEKIIMDLEVIFNKIVRSSRGGWCLENNFLFGWVLRIYGFTLVPRDADHFFETSHTLQTDPSSLFTNKSICSLQTPAGFRALIGWTYSEVTYKPVEGVDVLDMRDIPDDEIEQILKEKFSVKLPNKLKPINNKAWYTL
ncbi:arylamine N-acetyltransferase, pineal gland isozyme NAT-10-like [Seriola lalandi dorsalis]|uniref:arylamine N-acetyltransferase, pineal gland isozyme NAT-10-like n=1 Tax=Seriola lalandi dorsalis TaxID=1841481 RepID=UPI000C6FB29F|nr:arylamine N-acetyltransferase, pineal gland isozyme NAT-10-like [Seriola lalandi dorsalis]